jgi:hypothetical protein
MKIIYSRMLVDEKTKDRETSVGDDTNDDDDSNEENSSQDHPVDVYEWIKYLHRFTSTLFPSTIPYSENLFILKIKPRKGSSVT